MKFETTYKLSVNSVLKLLNRNYRKNYTLSDISKECGISREQLSRLSSDSKFSTIYNVVFAIRDLYLNNCSDFDYESYTPRFILFLMSDDCIFYI